MTTNFQKMPPALLLVGGLGTRLKSVVSDRPKPMAEIHGKPFLEWLLLYLKAQGVDRVLFASGYRSDMIEDHFGDGEAIGMQISYSIEPKPLGTGGAIKLASKHLKDEAFFLINGDTMFAVNLKELLNFHKSKKAVLSLAMHYVKNNSRYGQVEMAGDKILSFAEKPSDPRPCWINGGTSLIEPQVIKQLTKSGNFSFEVDVMPDLLKNDPCFGLRQEGYFVDIGLPETYQAFINDLPALIENGMFGEDINL